MQSFTQLRCNWFSHCIDKTRGGLENLGVDFSFFLFKLRAIRTELHALKQTIITFDVDIVLSWDNSILWPKCKLSRLPCVLYCIAIEKQAILYINRAAYLFSVFSTCTRGIHSNDKDRTVYIFNSNYLYLNTIRLEIKK